MTYCYILNVRAKYIAGEKLNVFCLCFESAPLVEDDTSTIVKDWQNEVLGGVTVICFYSLFIIPSCKCS